MSAPAPPKPFGPEDFAARTNVSRETLSRLKAYVELLETWNARHNLVSTRSLADVWRRHVWDSAQLVTYLPKAVKSLVDMGSGAGFPGLVLAELLRDRVGVVLYEATHKKTEFLAAAAKKMELNVGIENRRIEDATPCRVDVVTARALAPLDQLIGYASKFVDKSTICLFLKGQSVASELTEARKSWKMKVSQHQSATDPSGVILEIREIGHGGSKSERKAR